MNGVPKRVIAVRSDGTYLRLVLECGHTGSADKQVSIKKPMRRNCLYCDNPELAKQQAEDEAAEAKARAEWKPMNRDEVLRLLDAVSDSIKASKVFARKSKKKP